MFIPATRRAGQAQGEALESTTNRLLRAAADGQLTGDLHSVAPSLLVRLGERPLTSIEYETLADLLCCDHLVWIGQRITATAAGRQRLERLLRGEAG